MEATTEAMTPADALPQDADAAVRLLTALFDARDRVLFRPIETWTEGGRKRSRVDYHRTCYRLAKPELLKCAVLQLLKAADKERLNLFFGVCPRLGGQGRFDLAWQIRNVRAFWTDIDHVTVDQARERIAQAALPKPSIMVHSGNGVHLYWLLDEPFVIDDAGEPPPVVLEWIQQPDGRKKPRKFFRENGQKIYLDQRGQASRLSPKGQHLQELLAGIAHACGGDHTTDLARLLRLPGTLNRKNQRNGAAPTATALVECEPARTYPIGVFEPLRQTSPASERAKRIAAMPLPTPRKMSLSKADKLAELIAVSGIAETGRRSEADFALCRFAIGNGIAKEEVWALVEGVGKFAEGGRRYFDLTWEKAENRLRATVFDKLQKRSAAVLAALPPGDQPPVSQAADDGEGRSKIVVDTAITPVGNTLRQVTDRLLAAGNCFSRAEQLVVIHNGRISPILSAAELAGLLNQHVEFYFIDEEKGEYKPLPPAYANTWLNHHGERQRLPVVTLFTHNPVYTDDWRLVAPGFDEPSGIYYAGPPIEKRDGATHLDALLQDFCFKSPADRTNYLGVLLTALLIPRFIGSKPAALFNGNQPGLGKSILAQIIAILRDGHPAETATYNPNDEEFEKRLGGIVRRGVTTIIIDNAKGRGRDPRIESACLERSITDPILSYRLLGHSREIRAENSHLFCITANTPDVSRDLVTRSVVINLYHEGAPERRSFTIADPESYAEQHRLALLGELIGMVERWKACGMPKAKVHTRFNKREWGAVVGGILGACGERDFLVNADEAAANLDETRREFTELVGVMVEHPQGLWTSSELIELCQQHGLLEAELGKGSPRSLATKMGTLAGRFVTERFPLHDGRYAAFQRSDGRKGKVYQVFVQDETPNLGRFAEPPPNLGKAIGSAHQPIGE